jgi:glycosyltransferase involved in cell wall biosynthesis
MRERPALSVIVPVLDEEAVLPELHRRLRAAVGAGAELIFVDDGSRDGTPGVLREIARTDPEARALRLRRHLGKSHALAAGFARARGARIATLDADLQEDPLEIPRLLSVLDEGHDLVVGWRRHRRDRPGKVLASRAFNALVSALGGVRFRDINCGLKVLRREVTDGLDLASGFHRFIPLVAHWKGFRVIEREVAHRPREHGRSRFGGERFFHGLVDLAVILFLLRSEHRPSRSFIGLGALLGLSGFGISAYIAVLRLATGTIQSRYPLMALGILLLLAGLQVTTLGFFGELIAYHFRAGRPPEPAAEELPADAGREEVAR